jgi:chromosome segregation ATPase
VILLLVNGLNHEEPKKEQDIAKIKKSLDEVVHKLETDPESSESWGASVHSHPEEWKHLKEEIGMRQKKLKQLVMEKKSGTISPEEFEEKYRKLQDELTELEFKVYNLRLGTSIK